MPLNSKSEILNSEQIAKLQTVNSKHYDLEKRTYLFAKRVNEYVTKFPETISIIGNGKQLVRSSGPVGANYIETNDGSV